MIFLVVTVLLSCPHLSVLEAERYFGGCRMDRKEAEVASGFAIRSLQFLCDRCGGHLEKRVQ